MVSRTQKSIKNINVSMVYLIIDILLRFVSRSVFLDCLGTELVGLNTTIYSILEFLNLAELGVGTATAVTLYKPLYERDNVSVNEIIALQGHFYKRISALVICGGMIVMAFFPLIFDKAVVPLWCPYAAFVTFMYGSVIGNFVNYRQILLNADQKGYKISYYHKSVMIVKILAQIIAVIITDHGYVWWLVIEALFATIGAFTLRHITNKEYPYLGNVNLSFRELRNKYQVITKKVRQLFYHKITTYVVVETTPLIIYGFISLTEVSLYGNYMTILAGIYAVGNTIFFTLTPAVGSLVAEGNNGKLLRVYKELFYVRFIFSAVICFGLAMFIPSFVKLWLGPEYILGDLTMWLMVGFMFLRFNRATVDVYIQAYGLFADVWSPVLEGVVNLSLAVAGGYMYGLNGIIAGNMVGTVFVILVWKPYYLFTKGLRCRFGLYYLVYLKCMIVGTPVALLTAYILKCIPIIPSYSWLNLIIDVIIGCGVFTLLLASILYVTSSSVRLFVERMQGR